MKWAHLPMAGGLFDQKPELLDRFMYIFAAVNEEQKRRDAEEKAKRGGPKAKPRGGKMRSRPTY